MATHPLEMVNHPEEDSIRTPPPHHQDVHICYGPGQGPFLPCSVVATGFGFERNISYPEARKFVSMTNDSSAQKSYAILTKSVFTSVETQTDITWLNKADKPRRLMAKKTEKIINSS
jgi:hypothetical protein